MDTSYPFSNSVFRCKPSKKGCLETSKFIINFLQFLYKNLGKKGALKLPNSKLLMRIENPYKLSWTSNPKLEQLSA